MARRDLTIHREVRFRADFLCGLEMLKDGLNALLQAGCRYENQELGENGAALPNPTPLCFCEQS